LISLLLLRLPAHHTQDNKLMLAKMNAITFKTMKS
ncbi:MAG: hypothetical protein ACJAU1_001399, partial [Psychromonas sp.]